MSYFTKVPHDDGGEVEIYINDEQHIKELKAENVELLNECSAYAEHQETLENELTGINVEIRKTRKHYSDLKGQISNQSRELQNCYRDLINYAKGCTNNCRTGG